MSFGFISKQLPIKMSSLLKIEDGYEGELCFTDADGDLNIVIEIQGKGTYSLKIPEIEVLTLRSGSDKTHFKPESDLLILGLSNGKMFMKFPEGVKIHEDYKPSFDTKVILAHAVGNAIIASILNLIDSDSEFVKKTTQEGISISHWHGYFKEDLVPNKFLMYGFKNLHVACSSPQSAIYALGGKLESFNYALESKILYNGDVHVEPHHGTNVSAYSLTDLARYIVENPESTKLGNIYLKSE